MKRLWYVHAFVVIASLLAVIYAGGAQVAATWANHGRPAGTGVNIGVTLTVLALSVGVLGMFAAVTMYADLLSGYRAGQRVFGVALAAAVVAGDVWGAWWLAAGLPPDLRTHRPWFGVILPAATTFLTWWITLNITVAALVYYIRHRHRHRPGRPPS